jgi:hypothetical protein
MFTYFVSLYITYIVLLRMPFLGSELNLCSAATHSQKISAFSAIVYFICKVT